ncbi:MAG TPA: UvrD-helicase domain-containing protein [Candidatus Nanoarchaeia archaeon]|nr:UvrD-helicase domain-containing protein [Candidatus Nanoarchaeia archaeon]
MEDKALEYVKILKAVESIPFNVGKNLLIDFLCGSLKNESIKRNRLDKKELFGYFELYIRQELDELIENIFHNGLLEYKPIPENKFIKVIALTEKGKKEILSPSLYQKKLSNRFVIKNTEITEQDRSLFDAFDFFLKKYNEEQKKAIVSNNNRILCIAGAGSGKTTVLTKRIEFLTAFKSADPKKILAITFTRKARTEMAARLSKSQYCNGVMIETFNSFCEKIVKKYDSLIYKMPTRVISYSEKIRLFRTALKENNIEPADAITQYFSFGQRRDRTNEELLNMLMNDCYSVLELYKVNGKPLDDLKEQLNTADTEEKNNIEMVYEICSYIDSFMKNSGLRDYSDQIAHCIEFFKKNPEYVPKFEHVMIDEYQDVNSSQIGLIGLLSPQNIFCVGDPRQSIFGWRGSKIGYILNFEEKNLGCEIITLSTNYRSSKQIVELINKTLESSRLPELNHFKDGDAKINVINFESEDEEINFIIAKILELQVPRKDIFVLARTNRLILEISQRMKISGIKCLVRTEDSARDEEAAMDEVTLATIHSIKGLEADTVFVAGCTVMNFPCKASDHPIIELVRMDDYDKEEEERRLFYVALSRAKNNVYMTYTGKNHTRFINQKMLAIANVKDGIQKGRTGFQAYKTQEGGTDKLSLLKSWRSKTAQKLGLPAYIVMHDRTLMEIIEMNPVDIEDLRNIRGIGPSKLDRYGKEIMEIMNKK